MILVELLVLIIINIIIVEDRVVSVVNLDKNGAHNISENKFDWVLIIKFIIGIVTLKLTVLNMLGKLEVHAYHSSSNLTN